MVPVTLVGRAIAVVLMLGGIAFFSGMTANLASFLIKGKDSDRKSTEQLVKEIEGLRKELSEMRANTGR
jgi:hypothetical protein